MSDILQFSNQIFGNSSSILCEEVLYDFSIKYRITAPDLPSAEKLIDLCNKCSERDDIEIRFHSVENFTFIRKTAQNSAYEDYKSQLEQGDFVDVTITDQSKVFSTNKQVNFLLSGRDLLA